tara:strand:+ start:196 stop:777 length:582 start_codon:yes stop_codon:yes gene_type:complete
MFKNKYILIIYFILFSSCEDNTGPSLAENASIGGSIYFISPENWPSSGDITISISAEWPPDGPPIAYQVITISDLVESKFNYNFDNISFGVYSAIAVAWENPDSTYNSSCNKSILGVYGGAFPFIEASSISTSQENYNLVNYDFDAYISLAMPAAYSACYPKCTWLDNQADCEAEGHCLWNSNDGVGDCITKY